MGEKFPDKFLVLFVNALSYYKCQNAYLNAPCSHFYPIIIEQKENQFDNIYDKNSRHINHWLGLCYY